MIINYWQSTLAHFITILVITCPQIGYSNEHSPPFLLADDEPSAQNKPPTKTANDSQPHPKAVNSKSDDAATLIENDLNGDNLTTEQTPPFLLIDNELSEQNKTQDEDETQHNSEISDAEQKPPYLLIEIEEPLEQNKTSVNTGANDDLASDESTDDDYLSEDIHVHTSIGKPPFFSFLDDHQKLISSYLHKTVLGVDNFFATNQAFNESTGSHLRITFETIWPEGQGAEFDGSISLRARFPGIKEKYRLVIESDPEEQQDLVELESRQKDPASTTNENTGLFTGVEKSVGFFGWKARPSLGVKIRSPLDVYARLRIDRSEFFKKWALYLNESLYWFDSSGFGFDSTMRWDRPLTRTFLFRTTSLLRYTDETDIYDFSQTAEIVHTLSHKRAITYKIAGFANSDGSIHATDYLTSVLYRQNIHSDYLFLDLQTQTLFNKDNNFEAQHEFLMRVEIFYRD